MKFVKKLYIMTGKNGGSGAVTVERSAFGSFAELSLSQVSGGRKYFAFISDRVLVFPYKKGNRYDLSDAELSPAHVALCGVSGREIEVELYGTDCGHRLWQSNLCDMVRGKINDFEKAASENKGGEENSQAEKSEIKRLSLFPTAAEYDDNAIAKVNYYSNMYSSRQHTRAEDERLARLGGELLKARFSLEEEKPVSIKDVFSLTAKQLEDEELSPSSRSQSREDEEEKTDFASADANERIDRSAEIPPKEKGLPLYARFVNMYRDELLKQNSARQHAEPYSSARAQSEALASVQTEKEDAPLAPKADLKKSEQLLKEQVKTKLDFYERMKKKLDRLFEENERDETLEKLLPGSKFARIGIENSDKYYCVGLIGRPDYICYAVPAAYTPEKPEELDGYCQWLPLDEHEPEGRGFWLLYQDAITGESLTDEEFTII